MYNQLLEYFQKNNTDTECNHVVKDTPTSSVSSVKQNVNVCPTVGYTLQDVDSQAKFIEWYKNVHLC